MSIGAIFFNHGQGHCARLLASLFSLRKLHPNLPACILDTGYSEGVIEKIASDNRLAASVKPIKFVQRRRNSCYCQKASLWRDSPFENFLFLDSDTLIVRDISPLLTEVERPSNAPLLVTQFADWTTYTKVIKLRIERWDGVKAEGIRVDRLIHASFSEPRPAINTGIFGVRTREAGNILSAWERLTHAGWRLPWTDEIACQIIVRQFHHAVAPSCWNASPIYYKGSEPARIYHAHGAKALLRPDGRGSEGDRIWSPFFAEAFAENIGGIREWAPAQDDALAHNLGRFLTV